MLSLGIDLSGSERRPTGMCALNGTMYAKTWVFYSGTEIIDSTLSMQPDVIAIDAPLSLPRGRSSLKCAHGPSLRECERQLMRMGIRLIPMTLGPMRLLTNRALAMKSSFTALGFTVIEVFPGGAQDVLGVNKKGGGLRSLMSDLVRIGIQGLSQDVSSHELDAAFAAIVGLHYLRGEAVPFGDRAEGVIYMPRGSGMRSCNGSIS